MITDSGVCDIYVFNKHRVKYLCATVLAHESTGEVFEETIVVEPDSSYTITFTGTGDAKWEVEVINVRFSEDGT